MLYPLLWMLSSSFKPEDEIFTDLGLIPTALDLRQLHPRGWTALRRQLHHLLRELASIIAGFAVHRQPAGLLAHRLRLRPARVPPEALLVRADARHADAALSRHAGAAVHPLPAPRLGEHLPAADRAEVPRRRRLLHLPDGAVLPRHPARDRRGGDHGRLRPVAHLLADHAAAVDARCWPPPRSSPSSGPRTTSSGR